MMLQIHQLFRPVATMDKLDIIKVAEEIDTFELSIQPFEDCCTVFARQVQRQNRNWRRLANMKHVLMWKG